MSDPLKPTIEWREAQHKSFEELKAEADAKKAKRESLQPMQLGRGQYANIFKVGDRTRPELALKLDDARRDTRGDLGTGQVDLAELIPPDAFRDLDHAIAQANVTAQAETMEGIREDIVYDRDEAEVMGWQEPQPARMVLNPPAGERVSSEVESAAFEGEEDASQKG